MFHSKGDPSSIRRLEDESDEEEENISSKWEEPSATKAIPKSQHNAITAIQTSNVAKTGSKRPLSNNPVSQLNVILEFSSNLYHGYLCIVPF